MEKFIQRFENEITGTLNGFDRLIIGGTLRRISYMVGMRDFLYKNGIWTSKFGDYAQSATEQLKNASYQVAEKLNRPISFVSSSQSSKELIARKIAEKDGIDKGLIAILTASEPCKTYDLQRDRPTKTVQLVSRWRKCLFLYHYMIDPVFGFMHARIQTWFPFPIRICINGREWLARLLDRAGIRYRRAENCFRWIEDLPAAQKLMNRQLQIAWPRQLNRIADMINPAHKRIFEKYPLQHYWSVFQSEWATDVMFNNTRFLSAMYQRLLLHGITTFSSPDVMRFLHRKLRSDCQQDVVSDLKARTDGVRIKHRAGKNSVKLYGKQPDVLRTETTINEPADMRVYRPKEGDPNGEPTWRAMRQGIADLQRRTERSQAINDRYLDALADLDSSCSLENLLARITRPVTWNGSAIRGLHPWDQDDLALFKAIADGRFLINGFRNRDLQTMLYKKPTTDLKEKRRRSSRVSRLLRMLRAHHIIKKIPRCYRYMLTEAGTLTLKVILSAQNLTLDQISRVAA